MSNNVPLTVIASTYYEHGYTEVSFGKNKNVISIPVSTSNPTAPSQYWIVLVDRSNLTVKESFVFSDNANVPAQLSPYLGNSQYFMIFTTFQMYLGRFPTGALYKFLLSEGAGTELKRGEQIGESLNCAVNYTANYTLVGVLGDDGGASIEEICMSNVSFKMFTTLELVPISFGGTTLYTPAALT